MSQRSTSHAATSQGPSAAEMARTLTAGFGTATVGTAFGGSTAPVLHAALEDGEIVLLAARRELSDVGLDGLLAATGDAPDHVVLVDILSYAPLPDLTLIRAHLSAAGWARLATFDELDSATAALVAVFGEEVAALTGPWSDRAVLIVEVAECKLHLPGGCVPIDAEEYILADVDPLAPHESSALDRVAASSTDRLLAMVRRLRSDLMAGGDLSTAVAVRPIGLDRYGLTLHCTLPDGDVGLGRLPFPVAADTVAEAMATITGLLDHHEQCQGAHQHCRWSD